MTREIDALVDTMIKHIVLWKLKASAADASKQENAQKIKELLEALPALIPEVHSLEVGLNFAEGNAAFDVALYSEFQTKEDLEVYRVHAEHVKAAGFVGEVTEDRVVVDYEN
jgi:hypothetical protein